MWWYVASGPSITDMIPRTDLTRDEDGDVVGSVHSLGRICRCGPDKLLLGSPLVAGVAHVRFVHRRLVHRA
jgi:hypothetical protein